MARFNDLTGKTFGEWKVTAVSHRDDSGTYWWRAICAPGTCDTEQTHRGWVLTTGKSTRCASCSHKMLAQLKIQGQMGHWLGTETGGWIITARSGTVQYGTHKVSMWTCRCLACGVVVDIPSIVIHKPMMPVCRHDGTSHPVD